MKTSRGKGIFRASVVGALVGALLTISVIAVAMSGQLNGAPFILIGAPVHFVCELFGYEPLVYRSSVGGQIISMILVPLIFNTFLFSFLFFTASKLAGYILSKFKKTSGK